MVGNGKNIVLGGYGWGKLFHPHWGLVMKPWYPINYIEVFKSG